MPQRRVVHAGLHLPSSLSPLPSFLLLSVSWHLENYATLIYRIEQSSLGIKYWLSKAL